MTQTRQFILIHAYLQSGKDSVPYFLGMLCESEITDAVKLTDSMNESDRLFFEGNAFAKRVKEYADSHPLPENDEAKRDIQYRDFLLAQRENIKMFHTKSVAKLLKSVKKYKNDCVIYRDECEKSKQNMLIFKTDTCCPNIAQNLVTITQKQFDEYINTMLTELQKGLRKE